MEYGGAGDLAAMVGRAAAGIAGRRPHRLAPASVPDSTWKWHRFALEGAADMTEHIGTAAWVAAIPLLPEAILGFIVIVLWINAGAPGYMH